MKPYYKLLFFIFFVPVTLKAQKNFKPGYIVNLTGDTSKGLIDYREWVKNPKTISFKPAAESRLKTYSAQQIKAFAVNGSEYFESYILPISLDITDIANAPSKNIDTATRPDTVFLRLIFKGEKRSLFIYTDAIKERFYIKRSGSYQPEELIYHVYSEEENPGQINKVTTYRSQLKAIALPDNVDNDKLSRQIQIADYNESDLLKIIQMMNAGSTVQFKPQNLSGINFFAGAGASYSTLTFRGTPPFPAGTNANSFSPQVTIGFHSFINKNTRSVYFGLELSAMANNFNFPNTIVNSTTDVVAKATLDVKQFSGMFSPQVAYNFYNTNALKIFIGVGMSFNFSGYNQYNYHVDYGGISSTDSHYPDFERFWTSFPIKAGVCINNRIEVRVAYIVGGTVVNSDSFSANISSYYAGINYIFGKN